jgi:hypothetical protein
MATEQTVHPLTTSQMLEQVRRTVPEITPSQAKDRLDRGEVDLLLDVREADEATLSGAVMSHGGPARCRPPSTVGGP